VGKTRSVAEAIHELVSSGHVKRFAFMAQNEKRTREICVDGPSGLIAVSPPWFRPVYEGGHLVYPNGAIGIPFTPETPDVIRGDGVQLVWLTEIQSWPRSKRMEAYTNARIMCSTSPAYVFWDCTPKRRHPILVIFFRDAERAPEVHHIVQGRIEDNKDNLGRGVIEDLRNAVGLAGTQAGREELDGVFSTDDAGALWQQEWIDAHRRDEPGELVRRILSVDPAISKRAGSDQTGISELGLAVDGQVIVLGDYTAQFTWEDWGDLVLDHYESGRCDCVIVERNRGGDAVAANLRARAQSPERIARGTTLKVINVGADATTRHVHGVVYVKEVHARGSKDERAGPVASLAKSGRISHLRTADLDELEDLLCTWVPNPNIKESPDRMDPFVHGVWELVDLSGLAPPAPAPTAGIRALQQQVAQAARTRSSGALRPTRSVRGGSRI